mgnify:FL=1|jgi:hypothetical protein|tara:strand:+ start:1371 stop:1547 length:177 start_codon:yes stop_codon:yes gene_type:complete
MNLHTSLLYAQRNQSSVEFRLRPTEENKLALEEAEFRLGWYLSTGEILYNVRPESLVS